MYSILLKVTTSTSDRWKYLTNSDGSIYTENDLLNIQEKVSELLETTVLGNIRVIKNCIINSNITVEEVESE